MSKYAAVIEVIEHYKRSILKHLDDDSRLLHCMDKLYKAPIKVEHLKETGVGKVVNTLRKNGGEVGVAAKALIIKWKALVVAKELIYCTPNSVSSCAGNEPSTGGGNNKISDRQQQSQIKPIEKSNTKTDSANTTLSTIVALDNSKNSNTPHSGQENDIRKVVNSPGDKASKYTNNDHHYTTNSQSKPSKENSNKESSSKSKEIEELGDNYSSSSSKRSKKDYHHGGEELLVVNPNMETDSGKLNESSKIKENVIDKVKEEDKIKEKHHHRHHHKRKHKSKNDGKKSSSHKTSPSSSNEKGKSSSTAINNLQQSSPHNNYNNNEINDGQKKSSPSSTIESGNRKSICDKITSDRKRNYSNANLDSNNECHEFKKPFQKMAKLTEKNNTITSTSSEVLNTINNNNNNNNDFENDDDSFDSSTGANFADVLDMLSMKSNKKSKKSTSTTTTTTTTMTNNAQNNDNNATTSLKTNNNLNTNGSKSSSSSSSSSIATKPDLLAPTIRLEPLDPNIALELPTISTNYKPRPLNQTVMDCVFNNNSTSSSKMSRALSDAEALNLGISSKTVRTKIYSGSKTGQIFQVPSLFDLCIRLLQKNIDALEYTGGVPFEVLKPVLERASPQQLLIFEDYNPYLMEDSDILWQQHVQRNYRTQRRLENESWREMFLRCQEDQERKLNFLADSIKQSQKVASAPIRKTQLAFVEDMVKPPRSIQRKQEQYGTHSKLVASPAARVAALSQLAPNAIKNGDMRLKVSANVKDYAQIGNNRPKKAPLMQKTLQFIRGRHKR